MTWWGVAMFSVWLALALGLRWLEDRVRRRWPVPAVKPAAELTPDQQVATFALSDTDRAWFREQYELAGVEVPTFAQKPEPPPTRDMAYIQRRVQSLAHDPEQDEMRFSAPGYGITTSRARLREYGLPQRYPSGTVERRTADGTWVTEEWEQA